MCGIVGYAGRNQALPVLIDGLKRLEYRGYDSAGLAIIEEDGLVYPAKAVGRLHELEKTLNGYRSGARLGIAHTRWATHGRPSLENAHPHCDCRGKIWLVHNGIIENYVQLKKRLADKGHVFASETDTEVIAHLIEDMYAGDLTETLLAALPLLRGAYGLVLFHQNEPDKLLAARCGSPLVIGLGEGETIVASDVAAILRHTKQVVYLNDGEVAEISGGLKILSRLARPVDHKVEEIEWDLGQAEKNGFDHFMLKEIFEQPEAIENSIRGRTLPEEGKAKLGGLEAVLPRLREIEKLVIVACGTARYAGLVGEYMIEEYAGLPVEVEYASEFRYRKPALNAGTAVLAISQSGETADTLAAVREAKEKGALALGLVNAVGSTIARETDAGVYNHIGPEIAVASTKAFTSQVAVLALLTVLLGRQRQMSLTTGSRILLELGMIPDKMREVLRQADRVKALAEKYGQAEHFAFLGRKYNRAAASEGALKLKEISYIHAEGWPAGEMKHGPIALIGRNFPSFFLAPRDSVYDKNLSNMEEIRSRGGPVMAVTTAGNDELRSICEDLIFIPKTLEMLTPLLAVIPLQLFAYYAATSRGCDVDCPRNLAKSVTVE